MKFEISSATNELLQAAGVTGEAGQFRAASRLAAKERLAYALKTLSVVEKEHSTNPSVEGGNHEAYHVSLQERQSYNWLIPAYRAADYLPDELTERILFLAVQDAVSVFDSFLDLAKYQETADDMANAEAAAQLVQKASSYEAGRYAQAIADSNLQIQSTLTTTAGESAPLDA